MSKSILTNKANYKTLIIAGQGSIGASLFPLGKGVLHSFDQVLAVDSIDKAEIAEKFGFCFRQGDINSSVFLESLLLSVPPPVLFVNLCANVDNVFVRQIVSRHQSAYLDSSCCYKKDINEYRFSKMMPYTLTKVSSSFPQWLCWGINPGLVEIITRKLISDFDESEGPFDVSIFEYDQLQTKNTDHKIAVGWCPDALVEEVMQSPSLMMLNNQIMEGTAEGTLKVLASWQNTPVSSRLVGHEDIWNIALMDEVHGARFIYGLHPEVMKVFDSNCPEQARKSLQVPAPDVPVFGKERIAVKVKCLSEKNEKSLVWEVDHNEIWQKHKVNGVQFQTCRSLLLAIKLLQYTEFGHMAGNYAAADLPIGNSDWLVIDEFMQTLDIDWHDAAYLSLKTLAPELQEEGRVPSYAM